MALLLKTFHMWYKYARDDMKDPRTENWFLVHSPVPIFFVAFMYLFVTKEWLPKFMENRSAYDLRKILVYYNLLQIVLNGYIVVMVLKSFHVLDVTCSPVDYSYDPHAMNLARLTWLYFMVKLLDMADTIFFILRKKFNHVTFLHVYHHFGIFIVGWVGTKYIAGGESIFLGLLNSFVHVVMYCYYLFAAWRPEGRETLLKIKKHVTQLQLVQFILLFFIYAPKIFTDCAFSKVLLVLVSAQALTMIVLFSDFYYRAYVKSGGGRKMAKAKDNN